MGDCTPYWGRSPEKVPFSLKTEERIAISALEVNEGVGKSVISVCKNTQKANRRR